MAPFVPSSDENQLLAVETGDAKEHLGLEIDEGDSAVVRCQQPFFAPLGPTTGLRHDVLLFKGWLSDFRRVFVGLFRRVAGFAHRPIQYGTISQSQGTS